MKLIELFPELSINPTNAKEIKRWILQLAIEGKLTKKWRIKNGVKFNWKKDTLENTISVYRGITFPKSEKSKIPSKEKIPCLRTTNVQDKIEWEDLLYIDTHYIKNNGQYLSEGDIVMSMANSKELVGKVAIIENLVYEKASFGGFLAVLRSNIFIPRFLLYLLRTSEIKAKLISSSSQTTNIANISVGRLNKLELLIPGSEEQAAIVCIVESLFKEVDELETLSKKRIELKRSYAISALNRLCDANSAKEWKQITSVFPEIFNDKETIKTLRETILQLAVQGKLTAKWRGENPSLSASELLEQIKTEKAQLVKDKKIKAEKPLPPIETDEIPFELPEGWVWSKLGEICANISSGSTPPQEHFKDRGVPYLKVYNIRDQKIDFEYKSQFVEKEFSDNKLNRSILHPGDIIMNIVGPPLGKIAIIPNDYPEWNCNQAITFFKPIVKNINAWIYTFLTAGTFLESIELIGTAGQDNISVTKSKNIILPLPPFKEQQIIVEKVNSLMSLCDELEANVILSQQQNELLLKQILKESLQSKTEKEIQTPIINLRQQLAFHIIYKSAADPSFGKTKFEKLLHLSDYHIVKQDWGQKYERHTAGPLDTVFTYPFLGAAQSNNLISYEVKGNLERICANKKAIEKQLQKNPLPKEIAEQVDSLIDKFIGHNYETPEIVSTLYAVWNNRVIRNEEVSNELLKSDFLSWDKQKAKYKDRLDKVIQTMQEERLVPDGWGKVIER